MTCRASARYSVQPSELCDVVSVRFSSYSTKYFVDCWPATSSSRVSRSPALFDIFTMLIRDVVMSARMQWDGDMEKSSDDQTSISRGDSSSLCVKQLLPSCSLTSDLYLGREVRYNESSLLHILLRSTRCGDRWWSAAEPKCRFCDARSQLEVEYLLLSSPVLLAHQKKRHKNKAEQTKVSLQEGR